MGSSGDEGAAGRRVFSLGESMKYADSLDSEDVLGGAGIIVRVGYGLVDTVGGCTETGEVG